eukprot:CAMPEP_0185723464 /NCGR_PEP_ID=MMETSP1171-20130828/302_1 /TAXON_ID=374046 /ORGANISM="Helicotheca tamensis, Strain CCMP826" /LENGTH=462 /DNA_ID=CAMNT_0028391169 /DNA_START=190 /DNA_END=1578 /DNA_ORIENTATION=+
MMYHSSSLAVPISALVLFSSAPSTTTTASHNIAALASFQNTLSTLPSCPLGDAFPIQHTDAMCNRVHSNSEEVRMLRKKPPHLAGISGREAVQKLAEEATWVCPDDNSILDDVENDTIGHMTTWIVKNEASTPVSIAYVDRKRNNLEVSAKNGRISPAHIDPHSVLRPGEWTSFHTFQGHIFHVRELIDIGGGVLSPGRVLLRHQPGLIPIGKRGSNEKMHCPSSALYDPIPELLENENYPHENHPHQRTLENQNEFCNVLHRGFVNRVGCPLDIYFAGSSSTSEKTSQCMERESNFTSSESMVDPSMACSERFKMHLGVNPSPQNYLDDWDSPIKFEGSYLTHRFVARMRHDPRIVVDEIVMEPHVIRDCPVKRREESKMVQKEKVVQEVEVGVEEKPASMDRYVPVIDGYYENSTTDLYKQMNGIRMNITAMASSIEAEEISMTVPEGYGSAKVVLMAQS